MDMTERVDRLDRMINDDLIIRHEWFNIDNKGRERACLLMALAPEVSRSGVVDVDYCPSHVIPLWMAHMTIDMDDEGSRKAWPGMVRKYARVARKWGVLSHYTWEVIKREFVISIATDAVSHIVDKYDEYDVRKICDDFIANARKDKASIPEFTKLYTRISKVVELLHPRTLEVANLYTMDRVVKIMHAVYPIIWKVNLHVARPSMELHGRSVKLSYHYGDTSVSNLLCYMSDVAVAKLKTARSTRVAKERVYDTLSDRILTMIEEKCDSYSVK